MQNPYPISKTTKNLSLLDTFHHFSAVQQVYKITQVESTRKWTSGITVTGTQDRLACMPVDWGKSWEPAHTSQISSYLVLSCI